MKLPLSEFVRRTIEEVTAELPPNSSIDEKIDFDVCFLIDTDDNDGVEMIAITEDLGREKKSLHRVSFSVSTMPGKVLQTTDKVFAKSANEAK